MAASFPPNRKPGPPMPFVGGPFFGRKAVDFGEVSPMPYGGLPSALRTPSTTDSRSRPEMMCAQRANTPGSRGGAQFTIIANVPYDTVRQDLVSEFRKFGRVELAMVVCDEASRHPHKEWTSTAGYAFVRFSKRSEAAAAIQAATIGLITIRGTRVRADWARKDSYAKRGRVSPTQGAPALGPFGVPDGISLLQHSLNSVDHPVPEHWQSFDGVPHWPRGSRNEAVLEALETAFASAFNFVAEQGATSMATHQININGRNSSDKPHYVAHQEDPIIKRIDSSLHDDPVLPVAL